MRILLIEDDKGVADLILDQLIAAKHEVEYANNGSDGLSLAEINDYDVLIVDRMLPELDGLGIIKKLRESGDKTPILILSALSDVDNRLEGLEAGGDDYLTKPYSPDELLVRLDVLAKRGEVAFGKTMIQNGEVEMNLLKREVTVNGNVVDLLKREYNLLEFLMKKPNQVVSRSLLLEKVWDYHFDPQTNIIDVHISRLRKKLESFSEKKIIVTVRGAGYMLVTEDDSDDS